MGGSWGVERGEREHCAGGAGVSGGLLGGLGPGEALPGGQAGVREGGRALPAVARHGLAPGLRPAGVGLRLGTGAFERLLGAMDDVVRDKLDGKMRLAQAEAQLAAAAVAAPAAPGAAGVQAEVATQPPPASAPVSAPAPTSAPSVAPEGGHGSDPEPLESTGFDLPPSLQPGRSRTLREHGDIWMDDPGPPFPPDGAKNVLAAFSRPGSSGQRGLVLLHPLPEDNESLAVEMLEVQVRGHSGRGREREGSAKSVVRNPLRVTLGCSGAVEQVTAAPHWANMPRLFAARSAGAVDVGCFDAQQAITGVGVSRGGEGAQREEEEEQEERDQEEGAGAGAGTDIANAVNFVGILKLGRDDSASGQPRKTIHAAWNSRFPELAVLSAACSGEDVSLRAVDVGAETWKGNAPVSVPFAEAAEYAADPFIILCAGKKSGVTIVDLRTPTAAPAGSPTSPFRAPVTTVTTGRVGGRDIFAAAAGAQVSLFDPRHLVTPLLSWHSLFVGPCGALSIHCTSRWRETGSFPGDGIPGSALLLAASHASPMMHAFPFQAPQPSTNTGGSGVLMWNPGARALGLPQKVISAERRVQRVWYADRMSVGGNQKRIEQTEMGLNGLAAVDLEDLGGLAGGLILCSRNVHGSVLVEEYHGIAEDLNHATETVPEDRLFGPPPELAHAHKTWTANPERVRTLPLGRHAVKLSQEQPRWLSQRFASGTAMDPASGWTTRSAVTMALEQDLDLPMSPGRGSADQQHARICSARMPLVGVEPGAPIDTDVLDAVRNLVVYPASSVSERTPGAPGMENVLEGLKEAWRGEAGPPPGSPRPLPLSQPIPDRLLASGTGTSTALVPGSDLGAPASQPSPRVAATQPESRRGRSARARLCRVCQRQLPEGDFLFRGKLRKACLECIRQRHSAVASAATAGGEGAPPQAGF